MNLTETRPGLRQIRHTDGWIFGTMLLSACLSLTASFVLSIDAVVLAADPQAQLTCNISSVLSCGAVGVSSQASIFGFPNAFLGLVAEPVVITIAVAGLGGVRFPRWFMFSAQVVYTLGVIFAYWLFYQSMVHIGALCPWCLLVTLSTTLVFATLLHYNVRENNLFLSPGAHARALAFIRAGWDGAVVLAWVGAVVVTIILKYGADLLP
ncbi:vitamin K epoxide reductase family protein [Georgenia satyanarayanai]|uniref:vitamin K epoxide reductase family protein n=1 Tax=Georgenia satyanarayanai TaxID=860221 RepID=UPI0021ACA323|nr:vitamin K epoxide reductase family protein [Georgenia satyanarayanai]